MDDPCHMHSYHVHTLALGPPAFNSHALALVTIIYNKRAQPSLRSSDDSASNSAPELGTLKRFTWIDNILDHGDIGRTPKPALALVRKRVESSS